MDKVLAWMTCYREWRAWHASVGEVGGVLACVIWIACYLTDATQGLTLTVISTLLLQNILSACFCVSPMYLCHNYRAFVWEKLTHVLKGPGCIRSRSSVSSWRPQLFNLISLSPDLLEISWFLKKITSNFKNFFRILYFLIKICMELDFR